MAEVTADTDVQVTDHHSVVLLTPRSKAAREWIDQKVAEDAQFFGIALVVEPRYVDDIVAGMRADGLEVS